MKNYFLHDQLNQKADGSCMIVVATDAPAGCAEPGAAGQKSIHGTGPNRRGGQQWQRRLCDRFFNRLFAPRHRRRTSLPEPTGAVKRRHFTIISWPPLSHGGSHHQLLLSAETMRGKQGRVVEALPTGQTEANS